MREQERWGRRRSARPWAGSCWRASSARPSNSTTSIFSARRRRWSSGRCSSPTRPRDPGAQRLSHLRHRLSRPAVWLVPVRAFRRPGRAQVALVATMLVMGLATTLIGALPGYATAGVCAVAACRAAVPAGRRAWRRVGRGGADRDRERAGRTARLVRHVPSAWPADRLLHRYRPLPGALDRLWRSGVRRLGLARPLPRERGPGRDRTLRSRRPRGDASLQGRDGADKRIAVPLGAVLRDYRRPSSRARSRSSSVTRCSTLQQCI